MKTIILVGFSLPFTINIRANLVSVSLSVELRIILFIINEIPHKQTPIAYGFFSLFRPEWDYVTHAYGFCNCNHFENDCKVHYICDCQIEASELKREAKNLICLNYNWHVTFPATTNITLIACLHSVYLTKKREVINDLRISNQLYLHFAARFH